MRKIIILGTGAGWERAPFGKANCEFWGLQGHFQTGKEFQRVYEFHSAKELDSLGMQKPQGDWMFKNVTHIHPTLVKCFPDAKIFDFEKYITKYGRPVFRCSISWMLAEAIEEKPDVIEIYGVTLSGKEEYRGQKPSVAAFVLAARTLGIKVYIDREDELFSCPWVYGYEEVPGFITAIQDKSRKIERDLFNAESEALEKRALFNRLEGQKDVLEWLKDSYGI